MIEDGVIIIVMTTGVVILHRLPLDGIHPSQKIELPVIRQTRADTGDLPMIMQAKTDMKRTHALDHALDRHADGTQLLTMMQEMVETGGENARGRERDVKKAVSLLRVMTSRILVARNTTMTTLL